MPNENVFQNYKEIEKVCKGILKNNNEVLSIILCGSRARGDFKKQSDYDIMFITQENHKKINTKFNYENEYAEIISKKCNIEKWLIQTSLWPIKEFKKEYKNGNSFIYCGLRDGKILASKIKINQNLHIPLKNSKIGALNRIKIAKENIELVKLNKRLNDSHISQEINLEYLGFCAMHICWAICMINKHYPISKYTVLKECKEYFAKNDFNIIKRAYNFYTNRNNFSKIKINQKAESKITASLKRIINKIEKQCSLE